MNPVVSDQNQKYWCELMTFDILYIKAGKYRTKYEHMCMIISTYSMYNTHVSADGDQKY